MSIKQDVTQRFFLSRLERLANLSTVNLVAFDGRWAEGALEEDVQEHLLRRALFSTYLDCVEQGVEAEARLILDGLRTGHSSPVGS